MKKAVNSRTVLILECGTCCDFFMNESQFNPAPSQEELFLKNSFKKFYEKNFVSEPPSIDRREFGFGGFGKKISQRHLSFKNHNELNLFLQEQVPFYISYSPAYYRFPDARPMDSKKFLGGDIVYEFDADDLDFEKENDCRQNHDSWKCGKCGESGNGFKENCSSCGERVSVKQWFCENCLFEVKKQVFSLLDFLEKDFGFTEGISINFSGNAGYHIHLRSEAIRQLSHNARIELLDYLTGHEISLEQNGFIAGEKMMLCPKPDSAGWSGRISKELINFLKKSSSDEIAAIGGIRLSRQNRDFLEKKDLLVEWIEKKGSLFSLPGGIEANQKFWQAVLSFVLKKNSLKLDRQTSIDLYKIIRVPDTLHGSTGFIAKTVDVAQLGEFNPFNECIALPDDLVKVFISEAPKFTLLDECFGPFKAEAVELPAFAAGLLVGKGRASIQS